MNKKRKSFDPDADLDDELSEYEPSDSDDDYDDNEKLLLEKARKGKSLGDDDEDDDEDSGSEEEVLGVYSSDEEEGNEKKASNDGDVENMDSDIEGMEDNDKLPDPKAWGKRKKDYYHVDKDFSGFVREEDEQAAIMEEEEARTLQSKLAAELDNLDLPFGLISKDGAKREKYDKVDEELDPLDDLNDEIVKTDLSKLTKREKLALFQKESPEFFGLVNDYKERLTFAKDKLFPIMNLIKSGRMSSSLLCAKFVELKTHVTLNYCVNLAFYLVLKKKRIRVKDHPVITRLLKYRTLLKKLDELETPKFTEQLNEIVEQVKVNGDIALLSGDNKKRGKKKLKLLSKQKVDKNIERKEKVKERSKLDFNVDTDDDGDDVKNNFNDLLTDDDDEEEEEKIDVGPPNKKSKTVDEFGGVDEDAKRPITYEIAKNKGLTPHRKKEQRNPRVKNRNKYKKALIRRKGQVRQMQSETSRYGGEIFGIKASVIKSRKFK